MGKKNKNKKKPEDANAASGPATTTTTQPPTTTTPTAAPGPLERHQPQEKGTGGGGPQQQQRGPQQRQQPQQTGSGGGGPQQQQRGPPQRQQPQQTGSGGGGPQQQQRGPPQRQQPQQTGSGGGGPQQQQRGPPQWQQPQQTGSGGGGPQQQQRGPPQWQQPQQTGTSGGGPQQQQRGPPQRQQPQQTGSGGGGPQQQQRGPPQRQQPQQTGSGGGGPQQQQRGPPQWQQPQQTGTGSGGPQQQQRGPPQWQQPQQTGSGGGGPQQQQRGPPQWQQPQQTGSGGGGPQQQQRGPPQWQQPQHTGSGGGGPQQQQRGPPQRQQHLGRQSYTPSPTPSSSSSQSQISSSASSGSYSSSKSNIPRGTVGRPGVVETNYLALDLSAMPKVAYHYDVTITPDRPKKFWRQAFEKFNQQCFHDIAMAFDGSKGCYTVEQLPCNSTEKDVEVVDANGRTLKYNIAIKETDNMQIDLNSLRTYFNERVYDKPMRALQCLEVVMSSPCHMRGVRVGRSFFVRPNRKYDLQDGYEMWLGLYQAAILGDQPFLNVDISHKSFPSECQLIDFVANNLYQVDLAKPLTNRHINEFSSYISTLTVKYTPPPCLGALPRTYRVSGLTRDNARNTFFTNADGVKLSVEQYFNSRGYVLKYPLLNCLEVGSTVKSVAIPLELCSIVSGQATNRKDGPRQVQNMIRFAATSTDERKIKIMNMLEMFRHNMNATVQKFGINIKTQFIDVPTRLLPSPNVQYLNNEIISVRKGSWRFNTNTKFLKTQQRVNKWAIIFKADFRAKFTQHDAIRFGQFVSDGAKKIDMQLERTPTILDFKNIDQTLLQLKKENYDLVFVVLPYTGTTYADIKKSAELKHGILTQCIKEATILRRLDAMLVGNLLLKINAKLNGTNHKISEDSDVKLRKVMYLGADVTHPSPDQRNIPSVVGVAASHDEFGACYNMQYRLQNSAVENIEDMESIFAHHLGVYKKYQKSYPEHIIYYRDGVSDGQFPIVKRNELSGIRAACKKVGLNAKLTCIIVVKRHHTRFFPKTKGYDKFNNVEPGTVVDRVIVHPNEVQFFMVSHQSIQGTAKPTRYNVIEDDANMNIDLLQKLTYNLCHQFPRCNRAVSYPAPAYLAHLVASRGRVYLDGENRFSQLKREYEKRLVQPAFMQSNPMYFV